MKVELLNPRIIFFKVNVISCHFLSAGFILFQSASDRVIVDLLHHDNIIYSVCFMDGLLQLFKQWVSETVLLLLVILFGLFELLLRVGIKTGLLCVYRNTKKSEDDQGCDAMILHVGMSFNRLD